uniref:DSBA-like thioredoxin domain-containing protein n=1 Tax=Ciona savignyi TaxID=51511 RepID=H2YG92_CIOSA
MKANENLYKFKVTWEPFLLRPNLPLEGAPKPGDYGPHTPGAQRLINAGRRVGIDFAFKLPRYPNTLMGHCALEFALEQDPTGAIQNELQEALFQSYFTDGEYPDAKTVATIAKRCGLNSEDVMRYITDDANQSSTKRKATQWSERGVTGVPFFIINDCPVFSGAQEPLAFQQMFAKVAEKYPA